MTLKRIASVLLGLLLFCMAVILLGPFIVAEVIEHKYPEVKVGNVSILWLEKALRVQDIRVEREGLHARLTQAFVEEGHVRLEGGSVELELSEEAAPSGSGPSKTRIDGFLDTIRVQKGDIKASLFNTDIDQDTLCFKDATVLAPQATVFADEGCLWRDKSRVEAMFVKAELAQEVHLAPHVTVRNVSLVGVELRVTDRELQMYRANLGDSIVLHEISVHEEGDDIQASVGNVSITHSWISPSSVAFTDLSLLVSEQGLIDKLQADGSMGDVLVSIGNAHLTVNLDSPRIQGAGACSNWVDALPTPLPPAMESMSPNMKGHLSFDVQLKPVPSFKVTSSCKYTCSAQPIAGIRGKFTYEVYGADNFMVGRQTGPGTADWTSIQDLPPHVTRAFILLEDPGFEKHKGVLPKALENSLKINLEEGEFMRGGSTITMQLAKNLWLRRNKTIGRKAEEAMLTYALESCLSKAQILELYLNVIEFAPDVYGIGPGSQHYFKKGPGALSPEEAFFLASILPAPRKALPPEAGGLARARKIMKMLAESGFISDYMIDDAQPADTTGWVVDLN